MSVKALFVPHEGVRISLYLFSNRRMILQVRLKRWVPLQEFPVIYERRIFAELLGDFGMAN